MLKTFVNGHTLHCQKTVDSGKRTADVYELIFTLDTHSGSGFWGYTWLSLLAHSDLPYHFQKYTHMFMPIQENIEDVSSSLLPEVTGLLVLE